MNVIVGMGAMGMALALRLEGVGEEVWGVEPISERLRLWTHPVESDRRAGSATLSEVDWSTMRRVIVFVRTTAQVDRVIDDLIGLVGKGAPLLPVYVMSTLEPGSMERLVVRSEGSRVSLIECPVSGGEWGAREGTLTLVYASSPEVADDAHRLASVVAEKSFRLPAFGSPTVFKLLNNALGAYNARSLAEMLHLAARLDAPVQDLLQFIRVSSGDSWMARNFERFPEDLLWKDVELLKLAVPDLPEIDVYDEDSWSAAITQGRRMLEQR
jgi:3-hydroxyisobutyrate dehydrogenase-like beta-hydroxyacid dehydrogenase